MAIFEKTGEAKHWRGRGQGDAGAWVGREPATGAARRVPRPPDVATALAAAGTHASRAVL